MVERSHEGFCHAVGLPPFFATMTKLPLDRINENSCALISNRVIRAQHEDRGRGKGEFLPAFILVNEVDAHDPHTGADVWPVPLGWKIRRTARHGGVRARYQDCHDCAHDHSHLRLPQYRLAAHAGLSLDLSATATFQNISLKTVTPPASDFVPALQVAEPAILLQSVFLRLPEMRR
jgi:hypothetical protein